MPPLSRRELQVQLNQILQDAPTRGVWVSAGFSPDLELLGSLLRLTDPRNTTGASVATALDFWVAEQLRAAGLQHVLPRRVAPHYVENVAAEVHDRGILPRIDQALADLQSVESSLSLGARQLAESPGVANLPATRQLARGLTRDAQVVRNTRRRLAAGFRALRAEIERSATTVLGEGRRKQIDVFMASADRGLELAVSTKTLALGVEKEGELLKNLPNRWEEFDGDLKNLRGRFPLAAIGALLLVPESVVATHRLLAVVDMMRKLTAPGRDWVNVGTARAVGWGCGWGGRTLFGRAWGSGPCWESVIDTGCCAAAQGIWCGESGRGRARGPRSQG